MAAVHETYTVQTEGLTVPILIWRRFRKPMIGMAERVYLLNPGLAELGVNIPVGTKVAIPIDSPEESQVPVLPVVQLWD